MRMFRQVQRGHGQTVDLVHRRHHQAGVVHIPGPIEEAFRSSGEDRPATVQHVNAVRPAVCQVDIVSGDDDRHPLLVELVGQLHDLAHHVGVQTGGRLVHHQHLGAHGQRAGEGYALALPERQLLRGSLSHLAQAGQRERLFRPLVHL